MTHHPTPTETELIADQGENRLRFQADVLVIGGGPAGTWAAISAARVGASVVLVDKGYCGTSGAAAAAGVGTWYVPPVADLREAAMSSRESLGGYLSEREWMERVLDQTWQRLPEVAGWGYPFAAEEAPDGLVDSPTRARPTGVSLQGPDFLKVMRRQVVRSGVKVLDHSPVLELVVDDHGVVAGANGIRRQTGESYQVRAGAVVIASGGCAFLSGALGTNVDTGEGYLFAAEVGAEFSGMEFSNSYAIAPIGSSTTKTAYYSLATFFHDDGTVLEGAGAQKGRSVIGRALLNERVFAQLDQVDERAQAEMRVAQPNFIGVFDKLGIDPFRQKFEITLLLEGTVRGTGGIRIIDTDCATSAPGLYAAGDAATRELICGGFTGGGSHNTAWATASGYLAGAGAAAFARSLGGRANARLVYATGGAGLRPTRATGSADEYRDVIKTVQGEVTPYDKNYFRTGEKLEASLDVLHSTWREVRGSLYAPGVTAQRTREAAGMNATARWMYESAVARTETRGMHKRDDLPHTDPAQQRRLRSGGLDQVWTAWEETAAAPQRQHDLAEVAS
jgi:succinate dehydrogenase/fumarate reductase flavoprotein subunit